MYLTELINRHLSELEKLNDEPLCYRKIDPTTKRYVYVRDKKIRIRLSSNEGLSDVPLTVGDLLSQEWYYENKEALCMRNLRPINLVGV